MNVDNFTTPKQNFHDYNNVGQCPKLIHVITKTILSYSQAILNVLYDYVIFVHDYVLFRSRLLLHD